jgi:hypothetical protein
MSQTPAAYRRGGEGDVAAKIDIPEKGNNPRMP